MHTNQARTYTHVHTHTHVHMYACVCVVAHMYVYMHIVQVCMSILLHVCLLEVASNQIFIDKLLATRKVWPVIIGYANDKRRSWDNKIVARS